MDVELQMLKHLKRDPRPTVSIIDRYCSAYNKLFYDVRSYECFKYLHQGIISPIKRKSLPEIAKIVGVSSSQSLHHFLANSPWSVDELRTRRLNLTREALKEQEITLVIDETGDRKKGNKTDYVARQYLGSVGKIDRGIVSVNAYGVYENITFPLLFKVFKPKCKQELGWTDYRFTNFREINKWWEIIFSVYWMISSHSTVFCDLNQSQALSNTQFPTEDSISDFTLHQQWSNKVGWKITLNNLRLIIQPTILFWMIIPWLDIFPNRSLLLGFHRLIAVINQFSIYFPDG